MATGKCSVIRTERAIFYPPICWKYWTGHFVLEIKYPYRHINKNFGYTENGIGNVKRSVTR